MKNVKKLSLILVFAFAFTLLASDIPTYASTNTLHHGKGKHYFVYKILKDKLGYTEEELKNAEKSGKNAFELAKNKGLSEDQFKAMLLEEKSKRIDEKVKDGKLTKEKGEKIKARHKEFLEKWKGEFKIPKDECKEREYKKDNIENNSEKKD